MKRKTILAALVLLMLDGSMMAENKQTVIINGQEMGLKARGLSFDGDNVTVYFDDNVTQTADMEVVKLTFEWDTTEPGSGNEGDVNGDKTIDVADIASIIDYMSGKDNVDLTDADVNKDGFVDVADIATIIDIMAGTKEESAATRLLNMEQRDTNVENNKR